MVVKMKIIRSELEFSKWFKKNFKKLGYDEIVKDKKGKFPDFIMLRKGKNVGVELETLSSNFILHKHDITKVDEIVCIKKDIRLKVPVREVKGLKYSSRITRVSATIDEETMNIVKELLKEGKYRNKSHIIEEAIKLLKDKR